MIIIYNIYISIVCTYLLWSSYTIEKWKIIKNMVVHNNIFSMALHIQDLELFKKILSIDGKLIIQALTMDTLYTMILWAMGNIIPFFKNYIIT
ncbi:MAG: hypothetical protein O7D30_06520 [Rickettsia endosymbiont of Ixodes persulcatus]|nr:hypothetical protein [Rickettsia endosymbiont of Ixodes persulcatus]MCZ6925017.1 hypothetical protein [Rickettsia endosymbiont of Ixodes persulcatus]